MGADFVGIDEIQLCSDRERGHVFTDRLLHARGLHETLFMAPIRCAAPLPNWSQRRRFCTASACLS
jgi:ATP-dependent RNA helicase SUPV3L1/SUV3